MAGLLQWVLVGMAAYTLGAMALQSRDVLPDYVRVSGPLVTIRTKRGRAFLDWLASPRRFWRAWGNLGLGIALVIMGGTFLAVIQSAIQAVKQPTASPIRNPQNVLVIPGVNEFLPVAATPEIVFGLLAGLVVHEGGHGLLCRVENIDIDSMGVALFAFVPIGAFVEPKEESRNRASRGSQTRMFAAGVTNNFFVAFVAFALLFGPVAGSIAVASGVPVGGALPGSAASEAGLGDGDVITTVNGTAVANVTELDRVLDSRDGRTVKVGLRNGSIVTVNRSLLVTRAIPELLDGITLRRNQPTVIQRVNGTAVHTEPELAEAVRNRTVVRLETNRGNATFPVGAYTVRVNETGPFADAGAPTGSTALVITRVDGQRTTNVSDLAAVLDEHSPGTSVPVVTYSEDGRRVYNVTLGTPPGGGQGGWLGVRLQTGYSGLVVEDFGVDPYPAAQFLGYIGGGPADGGFGEQFIRQIVVVLVLPFFRVIVPGSPYSFAGFVPDVASFYVVSGPLEFLGSGVFLFANLLFWTGWVNLNLGLFNCIPTFPLDGGHLLRASAESFVARLPVEGRRRLTTAVTASISLVMLGALFLMLFGPQLFA